jgi:hypothetical protein
MADRKSIDGLPDTYSPAFGTGAQVAQTEKEAAEIYAQLPKGSRADADRLLREIRDRKGGRGG